jgi:hypothetical protein
VQELKLRGIIEEDYDGVSYITVEMAENALENVK